jgi:hypothetical protein
MHKVSVKIFNNKLVVMNEINEDPELLYSNALIYTNVTPEAQLIARKASS